MKEYKFTPKGVCSKQISFSLEDGIIHNVSFVAGCNGNLKAVSKLVEGQDAEKVIGLLKGNDCNGRGTSCADQFAKALEEALAEN